MGIYYKFLVFLLFAGVAAASGFGSSVRTDSVKIEENGTAEFYMLFWTENETQIKIDVIQKPQGWDVAVEGEINLSSSTGNQMVYISEKYIRATGVGLTANGTGRGKYSIIVSAKSVPEKGEISLAQERIFNLNVQSGVTAEERNVTDERKDNTTTERKNNTYIYIVILAVVLFISFVIYNYS